MGDVDEASPTDGQGWHSPETPPLGQTPTVPPYSDPGSQPAPPPLGPASGPYGSWSVPPAPQWQPPAPPWQPPPPSWPAGPAPLGPASPPQRGVGIGATIAIALLAALIGMAVGGAVLHNRSTANSPGGQDNALTPVNPATPSTGDPGNTPSTSDNRTSPEAAALAGKVVPGVVDINTKLGLRHASAAGTGMILSSNGFVLTNNHVIDQATSITATVVGTGRTYTAKVVGTDPTDDVAVIQLQGASGLKPVAIGDSSRVAVDDAVVAIGNAGGVGGAPSVVSGVVLALDQMITASDPGGANAEQLTGLIEIDAPLQPGDSGGPLVSRAGAVIGMNTAASSGRRLRASAAVGYAIPIAHAVDLAKQIESGQASSTVRIGLPGILGVSVALKGTAVVSNVGAGTPAEAVGLAKGDTITSVNGQTVDSSASLHAIMFSHHPGDKVTVGWLDRSGNSHSAPVTLIIGPAD